jgi:hypothetical protein
MIVVLATSGNSKKTNLDQVVKQDVQSQINALNQVVQDNTK